MTVLNNTRVINLSKDFLALVSGILLPFSLSPFDYNFLAFASVIGIILSINYCSWQRALWRGYLYGCSSFGFGVSWIYISIHEHGNASPLLAGFLTALLIMGVLAFYPAIKFGLYQYFINKFNTTNPDISKSNKYRDTISLLIILPSLWVIIDWIQGWLFTGFPWLFIGYSQTDSSLAGFAPVMSVFGLSWVVVLLSSLMYLIVANLIYFIKNNNNSVALKDVLSYSLVIVIFFISGNSLKNTKWTTRDINYEKTVLVQGSIPQDIKWSKEQINNNINTYLNLTEPYWQHSTIIWPESAMTVPLQHIEGLVNDWDNKAAINNSSLIFGIPIKINKEYFNGIISIGTKHSRYYKNKLVPWGEYVPFEQYLRGIIDFFDLPMSDFVSGSVLDKHFDILKTEFIRWLPFICYEIAYPDYVISHARQGDAIVTISNDAWFGNSIGPWQHLQIARMRALETGRPLARSTNNGITAFVNYDGQIISKLPQFIQGTLVNNTYSYHGMTPIMIVGVKAIIAACFLLLLAGLLFAKKYRFRPTQ